MTHKVCTLTNVISSLVFYITDRAFIIPQLIYKNLFGDKCNKFGSEKKDS